MRMAITRKFLDWSRPALPAVVDFLTDRYQDQSRLNLDGVVLVLPGGRAGRRLMEMLAQRAKSESLVLFPPQIRTAGTVPELLYESKRPFASDLVQQLAWVGALKQLGSELRGQLVAEVPDEQNFNGWMDLARIVAQQHRELAADGLDFDNIAELGSGTAGFQESERWALLSAVQHRYLARLDELELWDLQTARLFAIEHQICRAEQDLILVAMADMNRVLRLMFDQVEQRVTALVHAPASRADHFDEYGCLIPNRWRDIEIPLDTNQILVRHGPIDQANGTTECLARFDGKYRADQVVIGVLDERLVPQIQRSLLESQVPSRWVVGAKLSETGPCRLLDAVSQFCIQRSFASFAALVRHPDMETWLRSQGCMADYLSELDVYRSEHLQPSLGKWLGTTEQLTTLPKVIQAIDRIASGTQVDNGRETRLLGDWGTQILRLLREIYGTRELDRNEPVEAQTLTALERIQTKSDDFTALPESIAPQLTITQAIRLLLDQLSREEIPAWPDDQAIELLGWLELPLDTAPALIVTSFNEGFVPKSVNSDLFLPNALRQQLGLLDNHRRYARDAYALSVLVASRESLHVIVGRRSLDDDPMIPSRLAFATDLETMTRRVQRFFQHDEIQGVQRRVQYGNDASADHSLVVVPPPAPLDEPIESLSVTAFRDYLACPYRFYLRHVLHLEPLDDEMPELDGRRFGTLAHEVLREFGESAVADSTDSSEIRRFLRDALRRFAKKQFGNKRYAAVEVQLAQLEARLEHFAEWQAEWAAWGWRIRHSETGGGDAGAALALDGGAMMKLRGRIDRIDRHQDSGEWAIFDYKTSDSPQKPGQAHFAGGRWLDLQLPLYRHLASTLGIHEPLRLGYIVLPKDVSKVGTLFADWTPEQLAEADAEAIRVATAIRQEQFWPPAWPTPKTLTDYAVICQDESIRPNLGPPGREATP
jgi:ATP-dependent helicase/nuclease subunit B